MKDFVLLDLGSGVLCFCSYEGLLLGAISDDVRRAHLGFTPLKRRLLGASGLSCRGKTCPSLDFIGLPQASA